MTTTLTVAVTVPAIGFEIPLDVVVLGLITGLTYALLGLGLTLVYKSSRVLNFAHGEMGALPALLVPLLVLDHGWSYWLALPVSLLSALATGALFQFLVIRRLRHASRLTALVATIAAAQALFVINILIPRGGQFAGESYPTPFDASVTVGNLVLGAGQLVIVGVVPLVLVGLVVFLRRSRLGRASRAIAENLDAARLAGVPAQRVSLAIWALAGLLAAASAILIGPTQPLNVSEALGPGLMLRALGAAMLGALVSMPGVFVGGLAIGVVEALVLWNYPIGGVLEVVLFVVIVASLFALRRLGQIARGTEGTSWSLVSSARALPPRLARHPRVATMRWGFLVAVLAVAVVLPVPLTNAQRFFMSSVPIFAIMGLSLVVLTGYAGQVSLGQFAFVAVGAAVGGRMIQLGFPHASGLVWAVVAGAAVALLIGLPALRIRGLFLAVTTLAFSVATSAWLFDQSWLVTTTSEGTSLQIPRPMLFGVDLENELAYYWMSLTVLVVVAALVHRLRSTAVGRSLIAVRDNEASAASLSLSPRRVKLLAFVVSGAIASLAGFLYGGLLVNFSTNPGSIFGPAESLGLVVMTVLGGMTTVTGAVMGAVWIRGVPELVGEDFGILFSGLGLLVVLLVLPGGLASLGFRLRDRLVELLAARPAGRHDGAAPEPEAAPAPASEERGAREAPVLASVEEIVARPAGSGTGGGEPRSAAGGGAGPAGSEGSAGMPIEAVEVSVRFGGVSALDAVSVTARPGEIVGIMGPNGAGKTTLFDVLSGQIRPSSGRVRLGETDITGLSPHARARRGLGRTFQQARLFDELTVVEAVSVALERDEPAEVVPTLLGSPGARRRESAKRERALELVEDLGLGEYAHRQVSDLSTGSRRLAELACVVALGARVLLLDEPTAGFSQEESVAFAPVLRRIRDRLDATVVVIDHDVPMMAELVDRLYVLEAGVLIAEGPPEILRENERVAAAYLGSMVGG